MRTLERVPHLTDTFSHWGQQVVSYPRPSNALKGFFFFFFTSSAVHEGSLSVVTHTAHIYK